MNAAPERSPAVKVRKQTALPAQCKLLPAAHPNSPLSVKPAQGRPPIYMKLSVEALNALLVPEKELSVRVTDKQCVLRAGEYEFSGTSYREPGILGVYLPEPGEKGVFRNQGLVHQRVTLRPGKPLKNAVSAQIDLRQPTESRIVKLLTLEPHTIAELGRKTQSSESLVRAVCAIVADEDGGRYRLRPDFMQTETTQQPTLRAASNSMPTSPRRRYIPGSPKPSRASSNSPNRNIASAKPHKTTLASTNPAAISSTAFNTSASAVDAGHTPTNHHASVSNSGAATRRGKREPSRSLKPEAKRERRPEVDLNPIPKDRSRTLTTSDNRKRSADPSKSLKRVKQQDMQGNLARKIKHYGEEVKIK